MSPVMPVMSGGIPVLRSGKVVVEEAAFTSKWREAVESFVGTLHKEPSDSFDKINLGALDDGIYWLKEQNGKLFTGGLFLKGELTQRSVVNLLFESVFGRAASQFLH